MIAQQKLASFKEELLKDTLNREEIFQKYIVNGYAYLFEENLKDLNKEFITKTIIADYLEVHIHEIVFVGSGKLGFSLKPNNLFNLFDDKFSKTHQSKDKSDLDIAIISTTLYNSIGKSLHNFTDSYKIKWDENEYYPKDHFKVPLCYKYYEYFTKGWFRPDMKPMGFEFCAQNTYQELQKSLYTLLRRKTPIAIYSDWHYFMNYHIENLNTIAYLIRTETL